ncbi:MAG: domain S-box protein, partial [Chitinophagaceae bacterium]|nr:domain S-box protein [Chitinophagaceae bacterium]
MKVSEKITAPSLAEMLNDCSIDRVMAIDTDMVVIAWNNTSEITTGIKKADILGRPIAEALPQLMSNKLVATAIQQALNGYKSFVPSDRNSPELKYYESHFIPLMDENKIIGMMNIMHDVAHRIKVEEQLQKLNRSLEKKYYELEQVNKELGTFTFITSHELKEPLRHVYTSMEILITNEAQKFSNNIRANLRRIQSALSRMSLLLDDISALSQLSSFNKEEGEVNLADIVKKAK